MSRVLVEKESRTYDEIERNLKKDKSDADGIQ